MNARQIEKQIKGKVRKSKIQQILNYFFYTKEFTIWLEYQLKHGLQPLNGQFKERWEYILKFDECIKDENSDIPCL